MFKLYTTVVLTVGVTVIVCNGHEPNLSSSSSSVPAKSSSQLRLLELEPLIRIIPDAERPFELNEAAAEALEIENNKLADEAFDAILTEMAGLVAKYPDSPAAERVVQIADGEGYVVTREGKLYSRNWNWFYNFVR